MAIEQPGVRSNGALSRRAVPLHMKIFAGLIGGATLGGLANAYAGAGHPLLERVIANVAEPVGQLFLRLLLLLVVPLVVSSLMTAVAALGDVRRIGRIGLDSLVYTVVISAISVLIGFGVANVLEPGKSVSPSVRAEIERTYAGDAAARVEKATAPQSNDAPPMKVVRTLVPTNLFASVAADPPDMLAIMFISLLAGMVLTLLPGESAAPLLSLFSSINALTSKAIDLVMRLAPYAVFALLFGMTARFGFGMLASLGWYVAAVLIGLSLHMFGTYSLSVALLSRMSPIDFFRRVRTVMLTAFSTSSSNATLPTTLRVSEEELGVPRAIGSFVLTVGATANQNGTALFEGVTVLFLAQLAGIDLTISQQLVVLGLAIIGGIGTAGVPSGSIPFVIVVLATVGVNPALIAVVLGVDRLLDMCRTVLNVTGDLTIATFAARREAGREARRVEQSAAQAQPEPA